MHMKRIQQAAWMSSLIAGLVLIGLLAAAAAQGQRARMVRLCIASVDPSKLSSQCVMCNRREFPLTVIDCTGFSKMNDLIANPLSVQDATCLVYNCRRQVPDIRPEPYHGTAAVRANYPSASGVRNYEMLPPAAGYQHPLLSQQSSAASLMRFHPAASAAAAYGPPLHNGYTASSNMVPGRHLQLPYAVFPGSYAPANRFPPYDY